MIALGEEWEREWLPLSRQLYTQGTCDVSVSTSEELHGKVCCGVAVYI